MRKEKLSQVYWTVIGTLEGMTALGRLYYYTVFNTTVSVIPVEDDVEWTDEMVVWIQTSDHQGYNRQLYN